MNLKLTGIEKILVIILRHVGDTLLAIPALKAIKDHYPEARLSVLVNALAEEVLSGHPAISRVIGYEKPKTPASFFKKWQTDLMLIRKIQKERFDLVIDLTGGGRSAFLSFVTGARYRFGCTHKPSGNNWKRFLFSHYGKFISTLEQHTALYYLRLIEQWGIPEADSIIDFYYSDKESEWLQDILRENRINSDRQLVHVHPTSRWLFKCWGDHGMAALIDFLESKKNYKVVITSGPEANETERIKRILKLVKTDPVNLAGRTSIKQLAVLAHHSVLFIGVDSAPMHIAAAMNTPVIGIFGPTGAFVWGPWDNALGSSIRQYPGQNGLQRSGKHTVIQRDWECIPCGKDGCNGSKKSRCLEEIEAEELFGLVENITRGQKAAQVR